MTLTPCRDAEPGELPRTAAALLKAAIAAGWTTRATYAKAEVMDQGLRRETFSWGDSVTRDGVTGMVVDVHRDKVHLGVMVNGQTETWTIADTRHVTDGAEVGSVVESVVVRLRRAPLAAVGAWHGGKFHLAYVWTPFTNANKVGARQLSAFVKGAS